MNRYMYRKRARARRYARKQIGFAPGQTSTKEQNVADDQGITPLVKNLYGYDISNFVPETATDINNRQRTQINLRGWRINLEVLNVNTTESCQFNWAVISPKTTAVSGQITTLNEWQNDGTITADFFRDGTTDTRTLRFNDATTYWDSVVYNNYPINPDRFVILRRGKLNLKGQTVGKSTVSKRVWVPLRRAMRFYSNTITTAYQRVYFIFWCDTPCNPATSIAPTEQPICLSFYVHGVYREPRT